MNKWEISFLSSEENVLSGSQNVYGKSNLNYLSKVYYTGSLYLEDKQATLKEHEIINNDVNVNNYVNIFFWRFINLRAGISTYMLPYLQSVS